MATSERGQLGALTRAAVGLLDIVAETVEHTHTAVADRVFRALGPLGAGVRPIHDGITRLAHRGVRGGLAGAGALGAAIADHHPRLRRLEPLSTPRGARTLAAVSGIVGDRIAREHPELDLGLTLHHGEAPTPSRHGETADALVVFIHGLCEDERSWRRRSRAHRASRRQERGDGRTETVVTTHAQRLADRHGMAALYVRYNTGRRVQANGLRLAQALEEAVADWPAEVRRITLVGHSMGGLVARAACEHAAGAGLRWAERVSDVVYLGTPHLGAPLARGVHAAARGLAWLPETRGFTGLLDHRSDGVRDLTTGLPDAPGPGVGVTTDDAEDALQATAGDPPPLPGARHHLLAATLTRDPAHPLGRLVGDLLVRSASGSGRSRRRDAGLGDDVVVQGGIDHFDLLSDPDVGEQLVRWLGAPAPEATGRAVG